MTDPITRVIFFNPVALGVYAILIWGALRATSKRWDEHLEAANTTVVFAFLGILTVTALLTVGTGVIAFTISFMILKAAHAEIGDAFLLILVGPALCLLLGAIACWIFGPRIGKLIWPSSPASSE